MKTPDYILTEDFNHYMGPHDSRKLPAGSFVRPIEFRWLPKHIQESPDGIWNKFHSDKIYCYTHYGIILIPKNILRER